MTTRERWDETRALIEADPRRWDWCGEVARLIYEQKCAECWTNLADIDWADIKRADADAERQIYGDAGKFMRGGEPS